MIDNNKKYSDTRVRNPQKSTMAENHLSKHGRFGDTEMYRTSGGELWHVNEREKSLMDSLGTSGEHLVSLKGSGTRNPTTGLKEQFEPATMISLGLSFLGGISSSQSAAQAGRDSAEVARASLSHINNAMELLPETKERKESSLRTDFELGQEKVHQETGLSTQQLNKQTNDALKKSGFATQGQVTENRESMWKNLVTGLRGVEKNLLGKYAAGMGEVEGWFKGETARLEGEKKVLNAQIDMYENQGQQKFLGIF